MNSGTLRVDLKLIADWVEPKSRVLDVGCGDGELLRHLAHAKNVDGRGIELSMAGVSAAVRRGLAVIQGDADTDLKDYPSGAFDTVILSQTLQATRNPREVLGHLLRIGRRAIVSFPNFGHWRIRVHLLAFGRMPVTAALDANWYDTPNIHLCTIRDFTALAGELGLSIEKALSLTQEGRVRPFAPGDPWANLLGEHGLFLLSSRTAR
jgi:methionine biosynthesis protein MetW